MLAEMAISTEATRLLYPRRPGATITATATRTPLGVRKAFGAIARSQTAIDAVQVFGGNGYVRDYPVEKLMRDAKVLQI